MAKTVVIGAGMGGLATATWLADFGHDVTVFEQLDYAGGRLRAVVHNGRTVELAPGPITLPAVLRDLFRKTGRPLERVLDLEPADPAFGYRFADGTTLDLPASRGGTARALTVAFGAGSAAAWQDVVDYGGAVWAAARAPYLTSAPTRLQRAGIRLSHPKRRALGLDETLRSLAQHRLPEHLRAMLEHRAAGVDPRQAPAGLAAIAYLHQTFGRWRVAGGMSALVEALHARAVERGATIATGAAVAAVRVSNRRAFGVRLATTEEIDADIVISAIDSAHLIGDLLPRGAVRRPAAPPSPGLFSVTLALDPPLHDHAAQTVLLSDAHDDTVDALYGSPARLPDRPTMDLYASPDGATMTVTALVPPHGRTIDWAAPDLADSFADRLLTEMARRRLDVRGHVAWRHVRTPADVARETSASGAFGPALSGVRDALARTNRTNVRGLFLVGSSAYPGPSVPLVGMSAAIIADLIGRA